MEELQLNLDSNSFLGDSAENVRNLAGQLANLIKQSEEYQELLRLGRLINLDPEVNRLIQEIRIKERAYSENDNESSIADLKQQLEALPAYVAYVQVENAARDLFQSVDRVISDHAGIGFALNAKRSGCGCGG